MQCGSCVNTQKERPNFIIGADFLASHKCYLTLCQKLFTIRKQEIHSILEGIWANRATPKIARRIELPLLSEVLVGCKATKSTKYFGMLQDIAQPPNNRGWYSEDKLR